MISNEVLEELKDTVHGSIVITRALASELLSTRAELAKESAEADKEHAKAVEMADLYRDARDKLAALQDKARWVPVGERLPEEKTAVLIKGTNADGNNMRKGQDVSWLYNGEWVSWHITHITHWMPLPAQPEEGE